MLTAVPPQMRNLTLWTLDMKYQKDAQILDVNVDLRSMKSYCIVRILI